MIIGVAGGTGSGKTTFANKIKEEFPDQTAMLSHDYYYKSNDDIEFEQRTKLNYDHPMAFETELLISHIEALRAGCAIEHPIYSFVDHTRCGETVRVDPKPIILVEGILIFENTALCDLMDIKIFVDTDADVRILRRIKRDVMGRGRDLTSVMEQYLATVKPMHEQFVEPTKKLADVIVPEGGANTVALEMILERIRPIIR